ncbi:haloacid dehalogenase, type II [Exophiala sideris]|uniref:Haloacid dehalogenase, type II n=1 Tax=Exophiala sideris TaxID=1016849 RepID=A0A0D1X9Y7_9EURO|nr:haloacid dehalogenase, type II [Exophiala sideris]
MAFDLTKAKALFFDIYATLIDWEAGIYPQLLRLSQKAESQSNCLEDTPESRTKLLRAFAKHDKAVGHEHPTLAYAQVIEEIYARIAKDLGAEFSKEDQQAFGQSIGDWPAFPDTVDAMKVLGKYYKVFVLSNVDNASFERTRTGPLRGGHWDGIYTAEMVGSYKPSPNNYNYVVKRLEEDFSIKKDEMLLVAQSLDIDHISTKALGFQPGVWIARESAAMGGMKDELEEQGLIELGATYATLGDMAEAVEKAFESKRTST